MFGKQVRKVFPSVKDRRPRRGKDRWRVYAGIRRIEGDDVDPIASPVQ